MFKKRNMEILKFKSITVEIKNSLHEFNNRSGLAEKTLVNLRYINITYTR